MSITRKGVSLAVGAGAAVALVASAGTASAADPVDPGGVDPSLTSVNLLNVNDFHGRIDTDGTGDSGKAFACTVVGAKADLGEDSTALLSAGDNIAASPFTSSSQEDLPTIEFLNALGLEGSMGRVGAAGDNAAMESFFALLQKNVLNTRRWATRQQLRLAIVTWIERTYHRRRRQRRLGRLTPIEFETIYQAAHAA